MTLTIKLTLFVFAGLTCAGTVTAHAQTTCAKVTDPKSRLECYDSANIGATTRVPSDDRPTTATTSDILKPFAANEYKLVDPEDLYVAPNKYIGKPIELRSAHCFYADQSEYRCIVSHGSQAVMLITPIVTPADAKSKLESDCGTIKAVDTPKCMRKLHLVPAAVDQDHPNAFVTRLLVATKEIDLVVLTSKTGK